MTLSIFSCTYLPSLCLLCCLFRSFVQFLIGLFVFLLSFKSSLYLGYNHLSYVSDKHCLLICGFSFHSLDPWFAVCHDTLRSNVLLSDGCEMVFACLHLQFLDYLVDLILVCWASVQLSFFISLTCVRGLCFIFEILVLLLCIYI